MAKRILYVPWNIKATHSIVGGVFNTAGTEYISKNNAWISIHKAQLESKSPDSKHLIYQVWYNLNGPGVVHSPLLAGLAAEDQIYLRGHCEPGRMTIFSVDDATDKRHPVEDALDANEVVNRLNHSGLKSSFAGTIKCYNCNSFNPPRADGSNFASSLVTALDALGFTSCRVIGYYGSLDSYAGVTRAAKDEPDRQLHKHSVLGKKEDDGGVQMLGRASANRYNARTGAKE